MESNLLAWLKSIGLDEQRSRIYLATLSSGETTATELAKKMKMGRTAIYDNLRILEERGFVTAIRSGKRLIFIPLHPKELYKKTDNQRQQLKDLLPDFLSLYAETGQLPFVQLFSGPFAAREVYEDILNTAKNDYIYFSPPQETINTIDRKYIEAWIGRRVAKGIKSRALRVASKTVEGEIFSGNSKYLREVRYLHGQVDLKSTIYVYENNVAVIATRKENNSFIIHSPDLAFSIKQIFEFLWSISLRS